MSQQIIHIHERTMLNERMHFIEHGLEAYKVVHMYIVMGC